MIKNITITKNKDLALNIPWKVLEKNRIPVGKFKVAIKTPAIYIVPEDAKEETDWLDELLEDPIAQRNFDYCHCEEVASGDRRSNPKFQAIS